MWRIVALTVILASSLAVPSVLEARSPKLSILGGAVSAKAGSGDDTADAFLNVVNEGPGPATIEISLMASSSPNVAVRSAAPLRVKEGKPARVKVRFGGLGSEREAVKGVLVVNGGVTPVTRMITITPGIQPAVPWPEVLVIGAAGATLALFLVLLVVLVATNNGERLFKRAPGPKWSFDSWATTLTAVGAVLGTVLASATFPAVPRELDKDSLVKLNLLFVALVVLAPFVFQAIRSPRATPADQEAGQWGFNITLLLACCITFGAVLGELGALALLAWELIGGGGWAEFAVVMLALTGALAVWYFALTAFQLASTDWSAAAPAAESAVVGVAGPAEALEQVQVTVASPRPASWRLP